MEGHAPEMMTKLLEIAIRASGTATDSSQRFVQELGMTEIVDRIREFHPGLARKLAGEHHSDDWMAGYGSACEVIGVLGDLTSLLRNQFGEAEVGGFSVRDWTKALTSTAEWLIPHPRTYTFRAREDDEFEEVEVEVEVEEEDDGEVDEETTEVEATVQEEATAGENVGETDAAYQAGSVER